jgi:hypothetical protein
MSSHIRMSLLYEARSVNNIAQTLASTLIRHIVVIQEVVSLVQAARNRWQKSSEDMQWQRNWKTC